MGALGIQSKTNLEIGDNVNLSMPKKPEEDRHLQHTQADSSLQQRDKIVIIIPAFNEERFIGSVIMKAKRYAATIIVVDDGSTDSTAEISADCGAVVVRKERNQGKGAALNEGFQKASLFSPDVVVTIDADGQHLPEEIDRVVEPILSGEADIVIGSRYLDRNSMVPPHRIWGHRFFNFMTSVSSGINSTDSQSGYRAFSPAAVEKLNFHSTGFSVESEMQFIAKEFGLRLLEVPITIRYTDKPKRPVIHQGLIVLNGILRLMGQYRPLLFLGLPGAVMLVAGVLFGIWVVDIYSRVHELAVGYAMISVLLSIIGMLLISTGVILHSVRGLILDLVERRSK